MMLPFVVLLTLIFSTAENEMGTKAEVGDSCIMETLATIRSQATETNIYLQEIRKTLDFYEKRLDEVDSKLKLLDTVNDRLDDLETSLEDVNAVVEANGVMTATIKIRQEIMLSEVRIISLYKMTNFSGTYDNRISGLVVDGQFDAIMHGPKDPNQKLWIDLGGMFRIYRVLVWNRLDYKDRFVGTHIYADETLLGVATTTETDYEFTVSEKDPVYSRSVILHQPLAQHMHVREVQVWGTGPFAEDDRFN